MTFIGANVEALPQNSTDPSIGYGQPVLGPIPLSEAHRYVSYRNDRTLRRVHQLREDLKHLSLDQETTLSNGRHLGFERHRPEFLAQVPVGHHAEKWKQYLIEPWL